MSHTATGRIKITAIPKGEAPDSVRAAWVGLILPCYPTAGYNLLGDDVGVLSGKEVDWKPRKSVIVPRMLAVSILRLTQPAAADWWEENAIMGDNLSFGLDEVEIVEGVTVQDMIEVTDEMRGDPYR